MQRESIITALNYAIREREIEEKQGGYFSDSAMLSAWKEYLVKLTNQEPLIIE